MTVQQQLAERRRRAPACVRVRIGRTIETVLLGSFSLLCAAADLPPEATSGVVGATLCLNAAVGGQANLYGRIEALLGPGAVESPSDQVYAPPKRHIQERDGDATVGPHFAFMSIEPTDVNQDLVPMEQGGDRSRTEIKLSPAMGGVHEPFKGREGDTFLYTWRFKISPQMKFSPNFTHIHQLKASGGDYAAPPLITFTPLANGTMEFRHVADQRRDSSVVTLLATTPLAPLVGLWVDAVEEVKYSNTAGTYKLKLSDASGKQLLLIDKTGLSMWRSGAAQIHPKWGIYRKHHAALNQHTEDFVYFANFGITRGGRPSSTCRYSPHYR
jgi:hypothetical protein